MNEDPLVILKNQLKAVFEFKRPFATKEAINQMILDLFLQMYRDDWISKGDFIKIAYEFGLKPKKEFLDDIEKFTRRRIEA